MSLSNLKTLLITGGCGFIGSHLVKHWLKNHAEWRIVNLDLLTYAASLESLDEISDNPNYVFLNHDIRDRKVLAKTFDKYRPEAVIHLAAESHVDNSIASPDPFITTNIVGTFNLLEEARRLWSQDPKTFAQKRFHHVSTDEVYGSLGETGYFSEQSSLAPNSPYAASKAAADLLVRASNKTYDMNTVTTNCSNNFGPWQHSEKFIPTIIRKALAGEKIPVYGSGTNVRDWLFVGDHCDALDAVFHRGRAGETYAIGTHNEWKNIDLTNEILTRLDEIAPRSESYKSLISFVTDRRGHDRRYAIDCGKMENEIGWKATAPFRSKLEDTLRWYVARIKAKTKTEVA